MKVYDAAGRRKVAALWEAIAGIPERISEIAVLTDPGGLRYVGWNDTTNELELLPFDANDIPYDNTLSGLSATTVQEAIDELAGVSVPSIFFGFVSSAGTTGTSQLPVGWTSTRFATGRYRVTHGLGLASANDLSIGGWLINTIPDDRFINITALTTNSFDYAVGDSGSGAVNSAAFFIAGLNV